MFNMGVRSLTVTKLIAKNKSQRVRFNNNYHILCLELPISLFSSNLIIIASIADVKISARNP